MNIRRIIEIEPGGIIVVGQRGLIRIVEYEDGSSQLVKCNNCDFVMANVMTPAHRAIVEERWELRTFTGALVGNFAHLEVDDGHLAKLLTMPTRDIVQQKSRPVADPVKTQPKRPWWRFW